MKLEQQVASLELSKKLKELGVKQEGAFYWDCISRKRNEFNLVGPRFKSGLTLDDYAAFTVAELGEMLPKNLCDELQLMSVFNGIICWEVGYQDKYCQWIHVKSDKNEADARAKMLIYLIEEGIVKP